MIVTLLLRLLAQLYERSQK